MQTLFVYVIVQCHLSKLTLKCCCPLLSPGGAEGCWPPKRNSFGSGDERYSPSMVLSSDPWKYNSPGLVIFGPSWCNCTGGGYQKIFQISKLIAIYVPKLRVKKDSLGIYKLALLAPFLSLV